MENQYGRDRSVQTLSTALDNYTQKVSLICCNPECQREYETINLGRVTARYCPECRQKKLQQQERREEQAKQAEADVRYRELIAHADIPPKWRNVTFATSNAKLNPGNSFQRARQYAEQFSVQSPSLILYSPGNGTGKTHLAACILNHVLYEFKQPVLFRRARDLMLELRQSFAEGAEFTELAILDRILTVKLLLLDDVGVDRRTEWLVSTYWTLFARRLEWQLPLVITTNRPIEPQGKEECLADRIGEGAVSRLLEMSQGNYIDMTGKDLR